MAIKNKDFEEYIQQRQLPSKNTHVSDKEKYFFSEIAVEKRGGCLLTQEKSIVLIKKLKSEIT